MDYPRYVGWEIIRIAPSGSGNRIYIYIQSGCIGRNGQIGISPANDHGGSGYITILIGCILCIFYITMSTI